MTAIAGYPPANGLLSGSSASAGDAPVGGNVLNPSQSVAMLGIDINGNSMLVGPRGAAPLHIRKVHSVKGATVLNFADPAFLASGASFSGAGSYLNAGRVAVQSSGTLKNNPTGWHDGTPCLEFTPDGDAGEFRFYFDGAQALGLPNSPMNFNDANGIAMEFEVTGVDTAKSNFSISMELSHDATSLFPANRASLNWFSNTGTAVSQKEFAGRKYYRYRFDTANTTIKSGPFPGNAYLPTAAGSGADFTKPIKYIKMSVNKFAGKTVKFKRITRGGWSTPCVVIGTDSAGPEALDLLVAPSLNKNKIEFYGNQYWSALDSIPAFRNRYDRLYAAGWELNGNDLVDRPLGIDVTDPVAMRAAVRGTLAKHLGAGWLEGSRTWTANNNSTSQLMIDELQAAGYVCNRNGGLEGRYSFPEGSIPDPFRIAADSTDGKFLADIQPMIDRAIEYGATLWLYFHNIWAKAQIDADRTNNITGTAGAPIAVNAGEIPAAYRARAAALGTAVGTATVAYMDARIGSAANLATFFEDLEPILNYIGAKQQEGKLVTRTPSNWCRDVGLL